MALETTLAKVAVKVGPADPLRIGLTKYEREKLFVFLYHSVPWSKKLYPMLIKSLKYLLPWCSPVTYVLAIF
jgi:hypothetical protein